MRFWHKSILLYFAKITGVFYYSPTNTNYWWNFGFFALIFLILQIITGVLLAMFYDANSDLAFSSIIYIIMKFIMVDGLDMYILTELPFFLLLFIYICVVVFIMALIFILDIAVNFWRINLSINDSNSLFGLYSALRTNEFLRCYGYNKFIRSYTFYCFDILLLLWGGYSIDNSTLHRFYSLHYLLPFIILMLSIIHILFLHEFGSNNPLGISSQLDNIPFNPYLYFERFF